MQNFIIFFFEKINKGCHASQQQQIVSQISNSKSFSLPLLSLPCHVLPCSRSGPVGRAHTASHLYLAPNYFFL